MFRWFSQKALEGLGTIRAVEGKTKTKPRDSHLMKSITKNFPCFSLLVARAARALSACPRRVCPLVPCVPCSATRIAVRVRCQPSSRANHRRLVFSGGSPLPRASFPRRLCGRSMASLSSQQGTREAPPPDQLAALYSLTDKAVVPVCLIATREPRSCRHARR